MLGIYLKDKNLLSNENRISLTKVLSIIDTEIVENKLSYEQNPEIIVCNTFLSNILRVRSCHRGQILDLLTISFTDLEFRNYFSILTRPYILENQTLVQRSKK